MLGESGTPPVDLLLAATAKLEVISADVGLGTRGDVASEASDVRIVGGSLFLGRLASFADGATVQATHGGRITGGADFGGVTAAL